MANLRLWGEEVTHREDGSWTRDAVKFQCSRWTFLFRQSPANCTPGSQLQDGQAYETSVVEVENVELASLQEALSALDQICWLLTFSTQSRVIRFGYEFPEPESTGRFHAVPGAVGSAPPLFDLADARAHRLFVEQTFDTYTRIGIDRKLPVVFDYLLQAELPRQTMETSLLLHFVTLENLKDTYAHTEGIPYAKGFYRKASPGPKKLGPRYTFEELLTKMFTAVGMKADLHPTISLRNEIIHSGLSRAPYGEQRKLYEAGCDLIREYLLRLLGFRGTFGRFSSTDWSPKALP